ncbi:MAG: hypothetical protein KY462_06155 [Actinobacteria bacterium]|nr:hypothetical protein [Actinomycetota bacterium]
MKALLLVAGSVLIVVGITDLVWTTIAVAGGRGPVTDVMAHRMWRPVVRGDRSHRTLQLAGYAITLSVPVAWVVLVWGGWSLVFLSSHGSVVDAATQQPAPAVAKVAYAAGALSGAGAGYTAGAPVWQLANNVAALLGLAMFTLAVTYIFQVVTAVSRARALASRIDGLGNSPADAVAAALGERQLGDLPSHIVTITDGLALIGHDHLSLPVLYYFHVGRRGASIPRNVAMFDELITIVEYALDDPHPTVVRPAREAVDQFMDTLRLSVEIPPPPPPPDLSSLRRISDQLVDDDAFVSAVDDLADRRARLRALVNQYSWEWSTDVDPSIAGGRPADAG